MKKVKKIKIKVNGKIKSIIQDSNLSWLLKNLKIPLNKVAIELNEEIDEAILGGAIIKMGDKQIDGSVRRNLKNLKNTYSKNLYIKDF